MRDKKKKMEQIMVLLITASFVVGTIGVALSVVTLLLIIGMLRG